MPLLVGCNDFDPFRGSEAGKPITFTANTYYQNGIGTRTEYSGDFFGDETKYERINWVDEDLLHIWAQVDASTKENGDYSVESHETDASNQQNSNAKVKSVGTPLTWLSNATHTIYALYPSPNTENFTDASKVSLNGNVITATIPATQVVTAESGSKVFKPDMNYAFMWAATQATPGNNVSLPFKPLMTTFEFTVVSPNSDGAQLHSFALKTDAESPVIAGDFTAAVNDDLTSCTITDIANGATAINVDLGDVVAASDSPVTFTIFALPQDLTNLTMEFTLTDNTVKKLDLKRKEEGATEYTFITFEAGKKYRITNVGVPGDGWIYTLEEVEPGAAMARHSATEGTATKGMKSYRTKGADVEEVAMTFSYSPANEETGANLEQWSDDLPDWLTSLLVTNHTDEEQPTDPFTLTGSFTQIPEETEITINQIEDHIALLKAKGDNGADSEHPQDLALYDVANLSSPRSAGVKTANSYIVDRAGWYMFPLVYGNAIDCQMGDANGWNVNSYSSDILVEQGIALTSLNKSPLLNYVNGGISSPYILDDINMDFGDVEAVIVWEDAESDKLFLTDAATVEAPNTTATYKGSDGTAKTVPYIKFKVDFDNIRQGNALIALRESGGDQRIIWSWHIWITEEAMTPITVSTRSTTVTSNDFLPKPLGFCDDKVETYHYFVPRKYFVKAEQTSGNADPVIFEVIQDEQNYYITAYSSGTHYQYGRKDPMLPFRAEIYSTTHESTGGWLNYPKAQYPKNKVYTSPDNYEVTLSDTRVRYQSSSNADNFHLGIQNPYIMYSGNRGDWYGMQQSYRNLWNMCEYNEIAQATDDFTFHQEKDRKVYKTVYDPCPPGFSVPGYSAFTIFTTDGNCHGDMSDESLWNLAAASIYGYTYYVDDTKTATIYIPNSDGRRGGSGAVLPVTFGSPAPLGDAYYLTVKGMGDRYSTCFSTTGYWPPAGPMIHIGKDHAISVLPAKEIQ